MYTFKKNYLKLGMAILVAAGISSCSSDNDDALVAPPGKGVLQLKATATMPTTASFSKAGSSLINFNKTNTDVEVDSFLLNISEIELEFIDNDSDVNGNVNYINSDDEVELAGPFELDFLSEEITFLNVAIPNGEYEEIEFEFEKSTNAESDLFNKSILVKGTIGGTPFVFWHDFEEDIEVDYEDTTQKIVINDDNKQLVINFDLASALDPTTGVDLAQALDGNADGIIEISPTDTDGNNAIAEQLKEKIKAIIDLLDD